MLDTAEQRFAAAKTVPRRGASLPDARQRRDFAEDFAAGFDEDEGGDEVARPVRRGGMRLTIQPGAVPRTVWGRVAAGAGLLLAVGACVAAAAMVRSFLLHDDRFALQASSSIEVVGNSHLTRPQLMSVFGEDVERNIFRVSLRERQAELEQLPWVEHATVMRLLPDKLRIAISERTPVAFVRQGGHIGLVDRSGVLLDMSAEAPGGTQYSFPVVTGILAEDPLSVRAARMKIFERFNADLDSSGEHISARLSEVDLSNPEDVKALIPDREGSDSRSGERAGGQAGLAAAGEILVHFGDDHFLERYRKFEENLPKWRAEYPRLASADMRYERQVVLEMQAGAAVPLAAAAGSAAPAAPHAAAQKVSPHAALVEPGALTHAGAAVKLPAKAGGAAAVVSSARTTSAGTSSAREVSAGGTSAAGTTSVAGRTWVVGAREKGVVAGTATTAPGTPRTILMQSFDVPRRASAKPLAARPVTSAHPLVPQGSSHTQAAPQ